MKLSTALAPRDRTAQYWLGSVLDDVLADVLRAALNSGYQLQTDRVPYAAAPAVLILATFAREQRDIELVDDYQELLERTLTALRKHRCYHVEKYLASCICIGADRSIPTSVATWEASNIPAIFRTLTEVD